MQMYKKENNESDAEGQISGQNILPRDVCPRYAARSCCIITGKECWFCKFADFNLHEEKSLEVGKCCYPKVITQ